MVPIQKVRSKAQKERLLSVVLSLRAKDGQTHMLRWKQYLDPKAVLLTSKP